MLKRILALLVSAGGALRASRRRTRLKPYRVLIVISGQWRGLRAVSWSAAAGNSRLLVTHVFFQIWGIRFDILRLDQTPDGT